MRLLPILVVICGCSSGAELPDDATEPPSSRLTFIEIDAAGRDVWYDADRKEECSPCATEHNGTRCFPRFTDIDGSQLRYIDAECTTLIAWTDLDDASDKYVAYADYGASPPVVYSIYSVIERHLEPDGQPVPTESYRLEGSKCVPRKKESVRAHLRISYSIHPSQFALAPY